MRITCVRVRDFRSYRSAELRPGPAVSVISGRNGAGKTNLLEAVYVGCTGRSFRTATDREAIRFGQDVARVEIEAHGEDGSHAISVGLSRAEGRRVRLDGAPVQRLADADARPLAAVFAPDRLELVKGGPALRRAHLDQVVAALWPGRAQTRRAYAGALAQRNALLSRIRAGGAGPQALDAWDETLAAAGIGLMDDRAEAVAALAPGFATAAHELGLEGTPTIQYRPRSPAASAEELVRELGERRATDLERGFTGHGPHRDDLAVSRDGRALRSYGSQGEQRMGLLALLVAERTAIASTRSAPALLLDDAMSELDVDRRRRLMEMVSAVPGQTLITTTDVDHVPGARSGDVTRVSVSDGAIVEAVAEREAA